MEYLELCRQRTIIRLRRVGTESHVQIFNVDGQKLGSFPCSFADLCDAMGDKPYQFAGDSGSFMVKSSQDTVWFVFSLSDPPLEDSCLAPRKEVEDALWQFSNPPQES